MAYVREEKASLLRQYKYKNGGNGVSYKYLWSPLAEKLLEFTPQWIAPNAITSVGFCELLVTHLVFMWPDENNEIPFWKFAMAAVSIIVYQNLDNLDGKQARKTGSSTPLGMMFDHGVDSVVAFTLGLEAMKVFRLEYWFQFMMLPLFLMSTYFCCMWSQYCTGYFKLGLVNPIDEGLPFYALCFLLASQIDGSTFETEHKWGTYGQQVMYILSIPILPTLYSMSKHVLTSSNKSAAQAILMTLLFFISAGVLVATVWSIEDLNPTVFYAFYYATMFMWCRNMILIQLQQVIQQTYRVFNRGTVSYIVLCSLYVLGKQYLLVTDSTYFILVCGVQGMMFFEFVVRAFRECACVLGIKIFSLQSPKKQN